MHARLEVVLDINPVSWYALLFFMSCPLRGWLDWRLQKLFQLLQMLQARPSPLTYCNPSTHVRVRSIGLSVATYVRWLGMFQMSSQWRENWQGLECEGWVKLA